MIPRVAQRGSSFKGAGQYYLHDKDKDSSERVAWTHTHNIPTEDPELAMKWMAHTSINRDRLKQDMGVSNVGRKSHNKPVYSFSLAWHPEQTPEKEHMLGSALKALEHIGLYKHEAVIVAHNETDHPHVHVIANLVNPENGKTLQPSNDRFKLSLWAEQYEKEHGKVYCSERVVNNEKRREKEYVKHREEKVNIAPQIQELYQQSDNGKAFQAALEEAGYTLAKGDRRGYVLVGDDGKIFSLSRQLKEQRAKDIKERLADINQDKLLSAKLLSEERMIFDRDQYETERQKSIVDAAIEESEKAANKNEVDKKQPEKQSVKSKETTSDNKPQYHYSSFAEELDEIRKSERQQDLIRLRKEKELTEFYKRDNYVREIAELKEKLTSFKSFFQKKQIENQLSNLEATLKNIDQRMAEQRVSSIRQSEQPVSNEQPINSNDNELTQEQKMEEYDKRMKLFLEKKKDKNRGLER